MERQQPLYSRPAFCSFTVLPISADRLVRARSSSSELRVRPHGVRAIISGIKRRRLCKQNGAVGRGADLPPDRQLGQRRLHQPARLCSCPAPPHGVPSTRPSPGPCPSCRTRRSPPLIAPIAALVSSSVSVCGRKRSITATRPFRRRPVPGGRPVRTSRSICGAA
ncbi:unnamed protein product [Acanthosepion pharaonis]|uniref:Uncharacterized protein n=1 Tax=Acanthosepion pharaonis TaxID=158019 RepID=A0A812DJH9_ACAPH|nr:unnamed protein product [Sepia pharaonis]